MSCSVTNTPPAWRLMLAFVVLTLGALHESSGQGTGSKPIQFSEPRANAKSATNQSTLDSRRSRSDTLENHTTKPFELLDFENSLSGTPAYRPPVVTRAPARQSNFPMDPSKENWLQPDPLNTDSSLSGAGWLSDLPLGSTSPDGQARDGDRNAPTFLDSLRAEDWLVNGAMGESSWARPSGTASREDAGNPWDAARDLEAGAGGNQTDGDFGRRLNDLPEPSIWANPHFDSQESQNRATTAFGAPNGYPQGMGTQRSDAMQRREAYRDLLGLNLKQTPEAALPRTSINGNTGLSSFNSYESYSSKGSSMNPLVREPVNSLYPVRSADRDPFLPNLPVTPQRPSVYDSLETGQPASTPALQHNRLSNPLYQPPRRQH